MPSKTYDGSDELTGSLTYYVVANNDTVATGTAAPGKSVTAIVELPKGGQTKFKVFAKNEQGFGPAVKMSRWVGYDKPSAPASAVFQLDKTTAAATLKWSAVTERAFTKGTSMSRMSSMT